MLRIENLTKRFGARTILEELSFNFPERSRIALVGANGAGKTTLLNILCGLEECDSGRVVAPSGMTLGYLPQEPEPQPAATVAGEAERGAKRLHALQVQLENELEAMATGDEAAMHRYEQAESAYRLGGGYGLSSRATQILGGLGFGQELLQRHPLELSGGWRMRLELAKIFMNDPDFLILDEPTNHLDLPSLVWVEDYLKRFRGTLLFVSHDRSLLNRLSLLTLHLSNGQLNPYVGGFDSFLEQREARQEQEASSREAIQRRRQELERFVSRFGAKASKARQAQSRMKMIDRLSELESGMAPSAEEATIHFSLPQPPPSGRDVMQLKGVAIGYQKELAADINLNIERGQRIAIIGMNGIGKSTLLKTVASLLPARQGSLQGGHNVRMAYFAQDQIDVMRPKATVLENMLDAGGVGEPAARTLLGSFLFRGDDVHKEFHVLSGGEKSRLALARLLVARANFLLLDEPTNHLDMASVERLAAALSEFEGSVLFVSHNRSFINALATHIFVMLPDGRHALFAGQLEDYQRLAQQTGFPDVLSSAAQIEPLRPSSEVAKKPAVEAKKAPPMSREQSKERGRLERRLMQLDQSQVKLTESIKSLEAEIHDSSANSYSQLSAKAKELEALRSELLRVEEEWLSVSETLS